MKLKLQKINKEEYKVTPFITKAVIKEVLRIEKQQGLTAENLLEEAKDKNSPLNSFFEWNDTTAAHLHRLQQARLIINKIEIVVDDKTLFGFENVRVTSRDGNSIRMYKPVMEIMNNKSERDQIIKEAFSRMEYWSEKYRDYNEFKPIIEIISKTKKTLKIK